MTTNRRTHADLKAGGVFMAVGIMQAPRRPAAGVRCPAIE
jgi:hypothetical protein